MATGLKQFSGDEGLAPYGLRHSGESVKGKGYFGELPAKGGDVATEYSIEDESGEYPSLVPTLTKKQIDYVLETGLPRGAEETEEIEKKARAHADKRRNEGKSPFAGSTELRMPTPKKKGGTVSASRRADGIAARGRTRGRVI